MAINTLEYAKIFTDSLDKQMIQAATSGWMEENAGMVKYHGGDEVKIPKISMTGLGDYDRDEGYTQGSVTYGYQTMKLTQDRGCMFQLDTMDVDETNFGIAAGNVIGDFQRTRVIPEIDAYRYSKIASLAKERGKTTTYTPDESTILKKLLDDIAIIQDITGSGTNVIITMSTPVLNKLSSASGISRILDVSNFSQGGMDFRVKSIDGNPIISVSSTRMKTAYVFYDGKTGAAGSEPDQKNGGFVAAADAKPINWILTVRNAPIAVSKTDVLRIFDPMTNQKANAWRIDYRKFHDLWIMENAMDGVWVCTE